MLKWSVLCSKSLFYGTHPNLIDFTIECTAVGMITLHVSYCWRLATGTRHETAISLAPCNLDLTWICTCSDSVVTARECRGVSVMCAYIYCLYSSVRADKAVISFLALPCSRLRPAVHVRACLCVCLRLEAEAVWLDRRVTIKPCLCL